MSSLSPFLLIDASCDEAMQTTRAKLVEAGLRTVQTFNLNTARLGSHDCSCLNHGTEECDCQMIVLLVYGEAREPATLILHGSDRKTWVSVADDPLHPTPKKLITAIRQVLEGRTVASL